MLRRRELTVWLAFADLLFLLFVVALAFGIEGKLEAQKRALESQENVDRLKREMNDLKREIDLLSKESSDELRCAVVDPFLDRLSACVKEKVGRVEAIDRRLCSVTVSEDLLHFHSGGDQPENEANARALAGCIYDSLRFFENEHPVAFNSILTVNIDGHSDCEGGEAGNMSLSARRATRLYAFLLQHASHEEGGCCVHMHTIILSKIAVRSFGESRPASRPYCTDDIGLVEDRRVTVSVDSELHPVQGRP